MKRLIYSAGVMTLLLWNGELAAADTRFPPSEYQIRWSRIANHPIRLSELSAIAIGDRIHVVGGKITNDTRYLADNRDVGAHYEYDPAANTWIRKADMPTPRYDVALTALHGRIYAISSANESYDQATDSWQRHAPLPHGGAHQGAVSMGDHIFAFSAEGPSLCGQNMAFDSRGNSWQARASIPTPRPFAGVVAIDDGIYVMGGLGYDDRGRLRLVRREIEVYHPAADRWEQKRPMPDGVSGTPGAFDGKILLVGDGTSEIYVYDPRAEQWSRTTDLPHSHGSAAVTFSRNRIYVIGGHDDGFRQYDDAYVGVIEKIGLQRTGHISSSGMPSPSVIGPS